MSTNSILSQKITVENLKAVERGNLKAFCDVTVNSLKIGGCRIVQQPGQIAWVSMPQAEYAGAAGTKKYYPVVTILDKQLKVEIDQAVLSAWEKVSRDAK